MQRRVGLCLPELAFAAESYSGPGTSRSLPVWKRRHVGQAAAPAAGRERPPRGQGRGRVPRREGGSYTPLLPLLLVALRWRVGGTRRRLLSATVAATRCVVEVCCACQRRRQGAEAPCTRHGCPRQRGPRAPRVAGPLAGPPGGLHHACRPGWREGPLKPSERTRAKAGPTTIFAPIFGASPRHHTVEPLGLEWSGCS